MRIKVLSSAIDDLHAGRLFYENQSEGVGSYFFDSVFSDIDSLVLYAGIHQVIHGYHRMLSKRFPYAVYCKVEDDLHRLPMPEMANKIVQDSEHSVFFHESLLTSCAISDLIALPRLSEKRS